MTKSKVQNDFPHFGGPHNDHEAKSWNYSLDQIDAFRANRDAVERA